MRKRKLKNILSKKTIVKGVESKILVGQPFGGVKIIWGEREIERERFNFQVMVHNTYTKILAKVHL